LRLEPAALDRGAQHRGAPIVLSKRDERHQVIGSCDGWNDESVQVVRDRSGNELAERARIATVGPAKGAEVSGAVSGVDDRRRLPEADQHQIEEQPSGATVPVQEWVDPLVGRMRRRQGFDRDLRRFDLFQGSDQVDQLGLHLDP
jgi:hypothetical protein